ncbi:MAG: helix-turn-helix domain-containing protein [Micrococcus sp.]|nr:helix-turn-helix domain-containing protein [Micrococcus sp.]
MAPEIPPPSGDGLDLRSRRRAQTQAMIHEAAVELFESQGVKATTVEEIAARAGVSARTFFRHFASKEQAALPGQRRLRQAIDALELPDVAEQGPAAVLRAVEDMAVAVIVAEPQDELREHQRVRRILLDEPDVRGLATAQEQELVLRLRDRLLRRGGEAMDLLTARLIAETAMLLWRSCWDHWAELADSGAAPAPVEMYRQYRAGLRRILA